jgi:hypothetical protein
MDDPPVFDITPKPDPEFGHTFKLDWNEVDRRLGRRRGSRIARRVTGHSGAQIARRSAKSGGSNG